VNERLADILQRRHVRKKIELLKHYANRAADPAGMPLAGRSQTVGRLDMPKILTVDPDGAFVWLYETYGRAQNRGFAGSARPDNRDFLARRHVEIDVVEDHVIAIALCDASH
jgi:hypothetical protein